MHDELDPLPPVRYGWRIERRQFALCEVPLPRFTFSTRLRERVAALGGTVAAIRQRVREDVATCGRVG